MNNEVSLGEATFEQIAQEIHSRSRDFVLIAQAQDGTNGRHSLIYYSQPYGALGLAVFGKVFFEMMLLDGATGEQPSPPPEE